MEFYLVNSTNTSLLGNIQKTLADAYKHNPDFETNFLKMIPQDSSEPIFAVAMKEGKFSLIYTVHKEHKLTRNLSTVYHTQKIFEEGDQGLHNNVESKRQFEQWLTKTLKDGYKILGLNCGTGVFEPHQKYMDVTKQFSPSL